MDSQPALFLRDVHQPFQGIDTAESRSVCQAACADHPGVIIFDKRFFKFVYDNIFYILHALHEQQQTFVIGNQSAIGTFRLSFTYLFLVGFKLFSEQSHQSVVIIPETDIAVIDFLSCDKTVMVANVLIVFGNLSLDVVKLLIESTGFFGFTFCPVGLDVPQSKGHFFFTAETCLGSIDGDTAHNRCLTVFH